MSQFYYLNDEILGSCHLAVGERNTVLFDPGMAWYGEKTVEKIKEIIGDRPIDAVFLTHSHYDHVGALPVIKKYWPGCHGIWCSLCRAHLFKVVG